MSKIFPLPPQIGNIVGFDFVGRFNSTFNTSAVRKKLVGGRK
jgi:hypothetical protein